MHNIEELQQKLADAKESVRINRKIKSHGKANESSKMVTEYSNRLEKLGVTPDGRKGDYNYR